MAATLTEYDALEDCARNIFGRVMWSHKIQEKQADIYLDESRGLAICSIVFSSVASCGLIATLFADPYWLKLVSTLMSCISTILIAVIKRFDFEKLIQNHREFATRYLAVKDQLMLLLYQIRLHDKDCDFFEEELRSLVSKVSEINSIAPQTTNCAVSLASAALHKHKDDDITDEEINNGLPPSLRKECKK